MGWTGWCTVLRYRPRSESDWLQVFVVVIVRKLLCIKYHRRWRQGTRIRTKVIRRAVTRSNLSNLKSLLTLSDQWPLWFWHPGEARVTMLFTPQRGTLGEWYQMCIRGRSANLTIIQLVCWYCQAGSVAEDILATCHTRHFQPYTTLDSKEEPAQRFPPNLLSAILTRPTCRLLILQKSAGDFYVAPCSMRSQAERGLSLGGGSRYKTYERFGFSHGCAVQKITYRVRSTCLTLKHVGRLIWPRYTMWLMKISHLGVLSPNGPVIASEFVERNRYACLAFVRILLCLFNTEDVQKMRQFDQAEPSINASNSKFRFWVWKLFVVLFVSKFHVSWMCFSKAIWSIVNVVLFRKLWMQNWPNWSKVFLVFLNF